MSRKRHVFSGAFKAKVALAASVRTSATPQSSLQLPSGPRTRRGQRTPASYVTDSACSPSSKPSSAAVLRKLLKCQELVRKATVEAVRGVKWKCDGWKHRR